jgi:hypothetical protein
MTLAGGTVKALCPTKHGRCCVMFRGRGAVEAEAPRLEAFKHFRERLIWAAISAMPKLRMLRQIGGGKSRKPEKRSGPPRVTAGIRRAATNSVITRPPVSDGRESEPKLTARRCVRLRPVIAHCSVCGGPADEVHLTGDRRARCVQCCPVCNHPQLPGASGVTRPRHGLHPENSWGLISSSAPPKFSTFTRCPHWSRCGNRFHRLEPQKPSSKRPGSPLPNHTRLRLGGPLPRWRSGESRGGMGFNGRSDSPSMKIR